MTPAVRIGINAEPTALAATIAAFPGMASCRVFAPPGAGLPPWTNVAITTLTRHGITPWISVKDWVGDKALTAWLTAMPANISDIWLTYHHEPEGDLPASDYRRNWIAFARTVRSHRNASRIKLIPIHSLYPARHKATDTYTSDDTQWVGVFQRWSPVDKRRYVGDYMGWDCYLEANSTGYESPATLFRIPIAAAAYYGVPLVIPELGALRVETDKTGTGRAAWITGCLNHLAANNTVAVNWWHATGTNGANYRLTDKPSAHAWQAGIASHR